MKAPFYEHTPEEVKLDAKIYINRHIKRLISASGIKEKSPEWYLLMQLKTNIHEDKL